VEAHQGTDVELLSSKRTRTRAGLAWIRPWRALLPPRRICFYPDSAFAVLPDLIQDTSSQAYAIIRPPGLPLFPVGPQGLTIRHTLVLVQVINRLGRPALPLHKGVIGLAESCKVTTQQKLTTSCYLGFARNHANQPHQDVIPGYANEPQTRKPRSVSPAQLDAKTAARTAVFWGIRCLCRYPQAPSVGWGSGREVIVNNMIYNKLTRRASLDRDYPSSPAAPPCFSPAFFV